MLMIPTDGIGMKVVEAAPILNQVRAAQTKKGLGVEQTQIRIFSEFHQHAGHRRHHREPFPNFPKLVDSHTDQEDHKISFYIGRHTTWDGFHHGLGLQAGPLTSRCVDMRLQRVAQSHSNAYSVEQNPTRPARRPQTLP